MAGSAEGVSGKSRQQLRHAQIPRSSAGPGAAAGAGDREDCHAIVMNTWDRRLACPNVLLAKLPLELDRRAHVPRECFTPHVIIKLARFRSQSQYQET